MKYVSAKTLEVRKDQCVLDGKAYMLQILERVSLPPQAPRLAIVAFQPNEKAKAVVKICIEAIRRFTPEPYELWIIDNHSPREHAAWLLDLDDVNVIFNCSEPSPPRKLLWRKKPTSYGSYANAVGLEIAVRHINPEVKYFMALHMDTMPCCSHWLSYLQSKIEGNIRAVGVRMDRTRTPEGVLHVVGCLIDFQLFQQLKLNFWPQLPSYDVGDHVTIRLREAGYNVFACPNTLWKPELIKQIPACSPLRDFDVDRSFDAEGKVIFLHLGRGILKSTGKPRRGVTSEKWVQFAKKCVLSRPSPAR